MNRFGFVDYFVLIKWARWYYLCEGNYFATPYRIGDSVLKKKLTAHNSLQGKRKSPL